MGDNRGGLKNSFEIKWMLISFADGVFMPS